jgi:hypothetical protein
MANKVKIQDQNGVQVFPITHVRAVLDNYGNSVEQILGAQTDLIQQAQLEVGAVPSDIYPTAGSSNWATSGGIKSYVDNRTLIELEEISLGSTISYIINSLGKWDSSTSKHYLISVVSGELVKITANSSANTACYWLTSNAAPVSGGNAPISTVDGTRYDVSTGESITIQAPSDAAYLYVTGTHNSIDHTPSSVIEMGVINSLVKKHETELNNVISRMPVQEQTGSTIHVTFEDATAGYYDTSGTIQSSENWYYKAVSINQPEGATLYFSSSTGNTAASCFFVLEDNTKIRFGNDSGGTAQNPVPITLPIPSGTVQILFSVNTNVKSTAYSDITIPSYIEEDAVSMRMVSDFINSNGVNNLLLKKRRASVSFIFDDGDSNDSQIKTIFDNHNKKCGFAVYSPVNNRYVQYHSAGYEILAHASAPVTSPTEAKERTQMLNAYNAIVTAVGECHGWVTPSSALADEYKPLVYDYYEYGYTIYKGAVATPSDAAMTKSLKSYGLWRSSLQSLTLAEQKAIVDYAYANNLMICFYGHSAAIDTTDNLTTANLNDLLTYCDTVGIPVVLPYKSVCDFFAFRHNEDVV